MKRPARAGPLWGAPRIHGELQKLGIEISQAAVSKYVVRPNSEYGVALDPATLEVLPGETACQRAARRS